MSNIAWKLVDQERTEAYHRSLHEAHLFNQTLYMLSFTSILGGHETGRTSVTYLREDRPSMYTSLEELLDTFLVKAKV